MDYGLIVDVETTGINPESDKIIEIGVLEFAVDQDFNCNIVSMYSGLEDPQQSLKPEIVKLTHLTDEVLRGKQIQWDAVRQYFDRASIVVAHNCAFDRAFLTSHPGLGDVDVHWACSIKHVDWEKKGFRSRALNYLAADHGFVNPFAHRALFDCASTFRLVAPHMKELMENSYQREFRVFATGAPFDMKQKLKERAYMWDPAQRVWFKNILEHSLDSERDFLSSEIYLGQSRHQELEVSPMELTIR